jgi:guanylate kinase
MIVIIAGPSGAGKTTVCKLLVKNDDKLLYSISATTRAKRKGEKDKIDYYFISEKEFKRWKKEGRFVETAEVHGHFYGTLKDFVPGSDKEEKDILLDVDVKGKINICKKIKNAVSIFLLPPNLSEAVKRIIIRNKEKEREIKKRMETALREIKEIKNFDYLVINDDLKETVKVVESM